MKRPGLTPAMRRALESVRNGRWSVECTFNQLARVLESGLIAAKTGYAWELTPRGHAALAAEPMTPAEYHLLVRIADREVSLGCSDIVVGRRLAGNGWVYLCTGANAEARAWITDTGRTQLNNIRAAMPGEWTP